MRREFVNANAVQGIPVHRSQPVGGDTLVYDEASRRFAFGAATSGPSAGWELVYEVDFTALSTTTASGNGAFSIDGITWTVENYANADYIRVLNGTGLQIDPNATASDYWVSVRSAPLLSVPLSALVTDYDWMSDSIRVFSQVGATNADQNYELSAFGIVKLPYPGFTSQVAYQLMYGYAGAAIVREARLLRGNNVATTSYSASDDAGMIQLAPGGVDAAFLSGTMSGSTFPTATAMALRGVASLGPSSGGLQGAPLVFASNDEPRVEWAAYPVNVSNAYSAHLKRLRIERKR